MQPHIFFDTIIFSFLTVAGAVILCIMLFGRSLLKSLAIRIFTGGLIFSWCVIFYGSFVEPQLLIVTRQEIDLTLPPASTVSQKSAMLRVALVSDFHLGPYKQRGFATKVVKKIMALKPDIILIAGDFLAEDKKYVSFLEPLKNLSAPLGVYAVLGNHDYDDTITLLSEEGKARSKAVTETLEVAGVEALINEGKILKHDGHEFILIGTDDIWTGYADIQKAFKSEGAVALQTQHPLPSILLSHNADIVERAEKLGVNLVLAGHTHGGQIRLPFLGSVPKIPHALGNKYDRGLFDFGETQLFITSGLAETGPRARLLVPPEVALLEIKL